MLKAEGMKSILALTAILIGFSSNAHAGGDVCAGIFKSGKFVVFHNERGRAQYLEGREGDIVRATYDVQPHANRGLSMLFTGGTQYGQFPFENNFMVPKSLPGWGLMQQKYKGYPDKMIDVFFAAPEKAVKKETPLEELLEPGPGPQESRRKENGQENRQEYR